LRWRKRRRKTSRNWEHLKHQLLEEEAELEHPDLKFKVYLVQDKDKDSPKVVNKIANSNERKCAYF